MQNRCRYTRINGARCTMPALNNHDLCFQHQERRRLARIKPALPETNSIYPLVSFCYMDDHASILANLNAIADSFSRNLIDHRQVGSLTYLMQTCLKTLRQMKEIETELRAEEAVRDIEYAEDGLPLAADDGPDSLTLPTVTACADPAPLPSPTATAPRQTAQYEELTPPQPTTHLFSHTYKAPAKQVPQNQTLAFHPGGRPRSTSRKISRASAKSSRRDAPRHEKWNEPRSGKASRRDAPRLAQDAVCRASGRRSPGIAFPKNSGAPEGRREKPLPQISRKEPRVASSLESDDATRGTTTDR